MQTSGERRHTLSLGTEPEAVAQARQWIAGIANGLLDPKQHNDLRLVVSEVVTNALRYGAQSGEIQLAVTPKEHFLCVQVTDAGAGLAPRPRALEPDENGGFGLFLVEQMTRRWGVTRENRRTRVWFELDYRAAA